MQTYTAREEITGTMDKATSLSCRAELIHATILVLHVVLLTTPQIASVASVDFLDKTGVA